MAAEITNQMAVMVMTEVLDIPVIAGDCCISIKSFTKGEFEIVCTSKATYPIFEGISDHWSRTLMMLMLGCDAHIFLV
jgi:hypothetical protein